MRVVRQLDENLWRACVEAHPQGRIFHTPEMFQVFARTQGYTPALWAVVNDSGHPQTLFTPIEVALMGGPLRRFTSRAVDYAGVLCAPGPIGQAALEQLLLAYKRTVGRRLLFTEMRNLSDMGAVQPVLDACGFTFEDHLNYWIDLTRPLDELWSALRSNAQRNVRKARKMGVEIEHVTHAGRVPQVYTLLQQVYRRLQVPLADGSFFQASFDLLYPRGMIEILVARAQGIDIGALMLLLYKDVIIYWYTGALRAYSAYRAADLLAWYMIEWGQQHGFRLLDFGGAGKPDEEYGVRDFKAKFGGELVNLGRNVCVHAPLTLQLSKWLYAGARKLLYGRGR